METPMVAMLRNMRREWHVPIREGPIQFLSEEESLHWARRLAYNISARVSYKEVMAFVGVCQLVAWCTVSHDVNYVIDDKAVARVAFAARHQAAPVPGAGAAIYINWLLFGEGSV